MYNQYPPPPRPLAAGQQTNIQLNATQHHHHPSSTHNNHYPPPYVFDHMDPGANDNDVFDPDLIDIWMCLNNAARQNQSQNVSNDSCFSRDLQDKLGVLTDSAKFDILRSSAYAMTVVICYIVVISLGTLGNAMVVLTVIKAKQMWNATNIFIANLAVADIFVCLFDLPLSAYYQITGQWIFGAALCRIIPMIFAMLVYSSTLTLTMIAVDRYILVVHPLKTRMTTKHALTFIVIIAIIALAVASPIAIYGRYYIYDDRAINVYKQLCYEHWPTQMHRRMYTILTLIFQFFLPLLIIGILYVRIFLRIRNRIGSRRCSRRTKTTKMLVAVVTVFAFSWTPYHIHSVLSEYGYNPFGIYYKFADAILRVLAMSSSCLNPFLYGWLNENYKNAFLSIVKKPTSTPKGIHREESDRTLSRSNVIPGTPSPTPHRKIIAPGTEQKNSPTSSPYLAPPERVPLKKISERKKKLKEKSYNTIAKIENDPRSPVVIILLQDDEQNTDAQNNNLRS